MTSLPVPVYFQIEKFLRLQAVTLNLPAHQVLHQTDTLEIARMLVFSPRSKPTSPRSDQQTNAVTRYRNLLEKKKEILAEYDYHRTTRVQLSKCLEAHLHCGMPNGYQDYADYGGDDVEVRKPILEELLKNIDESNLEQRNL